MKFAQLVIGPAGSGKVSPYCGVERRWSRPQAWPVWSNDEFTQPATATVQSTYCETMKQHCDTIGRSVHVVNLGEWALASWVLSRQHLKARPLPRAQLHSLLRHWRTPLCLAWRSRVLPATPPSTPPPP